MPGAVTNTGNTAINKIINKVPYLYETYLFRAANYQNKASENKQENGKYQKYKMKLTNIEIPRSKYLPK